MEYIVYVSFEDEDELVRTYACQELIRCKDCKHGRDPILSYRKNCVWCERVNRHNDREWFCADGERREMDDGD